MKISGISAHLPSRVVTNDEVLSLIEHHSKDAFEGDLSKTLKVIGKLFHKSGLEARRWMEKDARPMALMKACFHDALQQASLQKEDIDLLIYTGVGRGFIEPANSCFVANYLGLQCRNFDVLDACMGWVSSMDIINDKMKAGSVVNAAIVSMELNLTAGAHIFPKNFCLKSQSELEFKYPSFTVGEAVAVTVLGNDDPTNFDFSFISRPDLSDLCTISLPGWESYCEPSSVLQKTGGLYQFNSRGSQLHDAGEIEAVNVFNRHKLKDSDAQHIFTHTSSPRQWASGGKTVGVSDKIYDISFATGNLVTTSIPVGLVKAFEQGVLEKNQRCLGMQGSAGMVFAAMGFNF